MEGHEQALDAHELPPEPEFRCDFFVTTEDGAIREATDIYDALNNSCEDFYALCMVGTKHDTYPLVWHVEKSVLDVLRRITSMKTESIEDVIADFHKDDFCFWLVLPATLALYELKVKQGGYIKGVVECFRVDIRT